MFSDIGSPVNPISGFRFAENPRVYVVRVQSRTTSAARQWVGTEQQNYQPTPGIPKSSSRCTTPPGPVDTLGIAPRRRAARYGRFAGRHPVN